MLQQLPQDWAARLQPLSRARRAYFIGIARLQLGELAQASEHFDEALHSLDVAGHARHVLWGGTDPLVMTLLMCGQVRAYQGLLDQAHQCAERALQVSEGLGHMHSKALAHMQFAYSLLRKGQMTAVTEHARRALELADHLGFPTVKAFALFGLGCAQIAAGDIDDGLRLLQQGFALAVKVFGKFRIAEIAAASAQALQDANRHADSAEFIIAGERIQSESDERIVEAELLRLRGRLLDHAGHSEAAAQHYARAIEVAQRQGAGFYALRAASDLAAQLRARGRAREADAVLRPIHDAFTEGFDYPDLRRARALLDGLAQDRA